MEQAPPPTSHGEQKPSTAHPPNQTLYIRNLTEKLSKDKLRRQLFNLFTRFGPILDVAVQPGQRSRGQAWVAFADVESSTKAKATLQSHVFFAKPMDIQFAAARSDVVTKLDGSYQPREKRPREERPAKQARVEAQPGQSMASAAEAERLAQISASRDANNPPGPVLKSDGIPEDVTKKMLDDLFGQYPGFKEVRLVAGKGVAFIEYFGTSQATMALQGLRNYSVTPAHKIKLNFAKQ